MEKSSKDLAIYYLESLLYSHYDALFEKIPDTGFTRKSSEKVFQIANAYIFANVITLQEYYDLRLKIRNAVLSELKGEAEHD